MEPLTINHGHLAARITYVTFGPKSWYLVTAGRWLSGRKFKALRQAVAFATRFVHQFDGV